jgi:hypothetical protein
MFHWLVNTLEMPINQNWFNEEMQKRLNSGNACCCYCWDQILLLFRLLFYKHTDEILFIYGSTTLRWALTAFSVSKSFYTVGISPWTGDQPVASPLSAHRRVQTQNKRIQTSTPQAEFEPTISVFERTKTVHALDRGATVIGRRNSTLL